MSGGFPVTNGVTTLIPPPDDVVPNFDDPRQNKWLEHYLVFGIGAPLAFIALCQRFYTKIFLSKGLQIDDAFMFIGWAMSIVTQGVLTHSIAQGGMCAHAWEMPLTRFESYSVATYITAPVYQLCNGFTKLSLLCVYLQLSPQKWFRLATWVSIVIVTLYTAVITLLMFFHCDPVRKAFDFKIAGGSCMDAGILYMATAVSNIITDVMLFILPTPMVLGLKMSRAQKIGAIVIFGIGSVTVATSVVRLTYLPATLKSTDVSWDAAPADVWTFVEANLFIICGSMPTVRKFFRHMFPTVFGGSVSGKSYGHSERPVPRSGTSEMWRRRKQYEQFTEDNEMHTFSETGQDRQALGMPNATAVVSSEGETDNQSEKAILQTKSYAVRYD